MSVSGKYFPSQVSGERVFLLIRRHWFVFAMMALVVVVLLVPIFILTVYWLANPDVFSGAIGNFTIVIGGTYILTAFGLLLFGFINYYLDVYIVTDKRIVDIKQNGFFRRGISELHLVQIQDVEAEVKGFFRTLLHYGDVHIQTAGEQENFIFHDVPHPYTLAKQIVELYEASINSNYRPQLHQGIHDVDDYRPEDYFHPEANGSAGVNTNPRSEESVQAEMVDDEESEGGIKYLEESYNPETSDKLFDQPEEAEKIAPHQNNESLEEHHFDTKEPIIDKKPSQKLTEMSEGEEVSLDDKNREI